MPRAPRPTLPHPTPLWKDKKNNFWLIDHWRIFLSKSWSMNIFFCCKFDKSRFFVKNFINEDFFHQKFYQWNFIHQKFDQLRFFCQKCDQWRFFFIQKFDLLRFFVKNLIKTEFLAKKVKSFHHVPYDSIFFNLESQNREEKDFSSVTMTSVNKVI